VLKSDPLPSRRAGCARSRSCSKPRDAGWQLTTNDVWQRPVHSANSRHFQLHFRHGKQLSRVTCSLVLRETSGSCAQAKSARLRVGPLWVGFPPSPDAAARGGTGKERPIWIGRTLPRATRRECPVANPFATLPREHWRGFDRCPTSGSSQPPSCRTATGGRPYGPIRPPSCARSASALAWVLSTCAAATVTSPRRCASSCTPARPGLLTWTPTLLGQATWTCRDQPNFHAVLGDARDLPRLVRNNMDFVFIANTFHGVPNKLDLSRAVYAVSSPVDDSLSSTASPAAGRDAGPGPTRGPDTVCEWRLRMSAAWSSRLASVEWPSLTWALPLRRCVSQGGIDRKRPGRADE